MNKDRDCGNEHKLRAWVPKQREYARCEGSESCFQKTKNNGRTQRNDPSMQVMIVRS